MKHLLLTTIAAVLLVGCGNPEADRALLDAAWDGNIEAVKQHLDAGADLNAKDGGGETPLHAAVFKGHKEIVFGSTPLHDAAFSDLKEVTELLIANGADVNAKAEEGWTPLHDAARGGHKEIAELLIAKGADLNAKDNDGETPVDYAIRKEELADLLRKHGGKTAEELKAELK